MPRSRPPYPPEFRAEAVELVRSGTKSFSQPSRDFGVSDQTLRNWVRQADRCPEGCRRTRWTPQWSLAVMPRRDLTAPTTTTRRGAQPASRSWPISGLFAEPGNATRPSSGGASRLSCGRSARPNLGGSSGCEAGE